MQPHPYGARTDRKDLRHQIRIKLFHVVEHQNDSVLRRQSQHSVVQHAMTLPAECLIFRAGCRIGQQQSGQLGFVR